MDEHDIWATCAKDVNESVSREQHLVRRGHLTTACGCTASTPDIWRKVPVNSLKPKCKTCQSKEGKS